MSKISDGHKKPNTREGDRSFSRPVEIERQKTGDEDKSVTEGCN